MVLVECREQYIPRKNKRKKAPDTSVIRKIPIVDTVNSRKTGEKDTLTDVEIYSLHKTPPYFQHKVDYEGDTGENNHCSGVSRTETVDCVRNVGI